MPLQSRSGGAQAGIQLAVGNRQMKRRFFGVKIKDTMYRLLALIGFLLGIAAPAAAQDAASVLLPRINNLRASRGLPAYAPHPSLTAAANNHARWMADNGEISHYQQDGSGPRTRAVNAGFPSNWISENIYRGASALTAWEFWLNSPIHYAGIVSPNYDKIGISSASGARGNTYVLVFGNSTGRLPESGANTGNGGERTAAGGQPSFVLGLDEFGNIKHEVQPGQTIGHILLTYGYTWEEYPTLLELNGMSEADRLNMQPGSVILVPPKDGTYTPAPASAAASATATDRATAAPTTGPSETPVASTATPTAPPATPLTIRVGGFPAETAEPVLSPPNRQAGGSGRLWRAALLGAAIVIQLGVVGAAAIELSRRSR